ncbi:MAG: 23S rRNA methyltransferase [Legionellales bacterium RIFCSPHIGHO2_12_FULL_35_11]|nr:MAG: 23S rRNA methyltransferase [Legionellales bacterium RIFCSPHIGHO2_12_FULL_35_11]
MKRSNSSKRWLEEHFDDIYVKKAQAEGKRSRAIYKLQEIDLKENLFKPGMSIVDLGSAPGGWTQYVAEKLDGQKANIIALDILKMEPISGANFIQGDFTSDSVLEKLMNIIPEHSIDVLLSDMAPNMSGNKEVDILKAMYLAEITLDFGQNMLKPGGILLMKIFHGAGFDDLVKQIRGQFKRVVIRKPKASRPRSRETYLLAVGYKL